tara:strand:+ start:346 stop:585 length:240 start_codon:yes stop_codon:yes gene_type:complete
MLKCVAALLINEVRLARPWRVRIRPEADKAHDLLHPHASALPGYAAARNKRTVKKPDLNDGGEWFFMGLRGSFALVMAK